MDEDSAIGRWTLSVGRGRSSISANPVAHAAPFRRRLLSGMQTGARFFPGADQRSLWRSSCPNSAAADASRHVIPYFNEWMRRSPAWPLWPRVGARSSARVAVWAIRASSYLRGRPNHLWRNMAAVFPNVAMQSGICPEWAVYRECRGHLCLQSICSDRRSEHRPPAARLFDLQIPTDISPGRETYGSAQVRCCRSGTRAFTTRP